MRHKWWIQLYTTVCLSVVETSQRRGLEGCKGKEGYVFNVSSYSQCYLAECVPTAKTNLDMYYIIVVHIGSLKQYLCYQNHNKNET